MALTDKLSAIGNAIRNKTGKTDLLTLDQMPTEIGAIETGGGGVEIPEEALVISGNCNYRFARGGWDWFIECFGDKITTYNVTDAANMFYHSGIENIAFEINFDPSFNSPMANMFNGASKLKEVPKINGCKPEGLSYLFYGCYGLTKVPEDIEDWFNWSYIESQTSSYSCNTSNMFAYCYSLRSIPPGLFTHVNKSVGYSYSYFNSGFQSCCALDELTNLPIPYTATWTSNTFNNSFSNCSRLKNLTFAMPNGQPYVVNWKSQTIDLNSVCGYTNSVPNIVNYNSGITADKEVKDDATYQALKDDPDWFTTNQIYSRYNHDSAVETINSLPDTSAYLATAGGTNTIKFRGKSGIATDGGAINTLTEEEIAVATAKGWTVTFA